MCLAVKLLFRGLGLRAWGLFFKSHLIIRNGVFFHLQVKRSIFASPESVTGKVGVGTCGIADKPMTQYQDTSKYNVRHLMPQ